MIDMPWCEWCRCYHRDTSPCIDQYGRKGWLPFRLTVKLTLAALVIATAANLLSVIFLSRQIEDVRSGVGSNCVRGVQVVDAQGIVQTVCAP